MVQARVELGAIMDSSTPRDQRLIDIGAVNSLLILLIPGTSSVEHLRENVAGAGLQLPHEAIKKLNAIAS